MFSSFGGQGIKLRFPRSRPRRSHRCNSPLQHPHAPNLNTPLRSLDALRFRAGSRRHGSLGSRSRMWTSSFFVLSTHQRLCGMGVTFVSLGPVLLLANHAWKTSQSNGTFSKRYGICAENKVGGDYVTWW